MNLSERIEQAAQRQGNIKAESEKKVVTSVNLGSGRKSNYGYREVGRPTNEGCEISDVNGEILNE